MKYTVIYEKRADLVGGMFPTLRALLPWAIRGPR